MRGLEQIPWLYDLGLALLERGKLGRWRRWLVEGARGRTLELGAGTGRDLPIYPPGQPVIALDPHPENIVTARRRAPSVPHVRARAEALPFRTGTFDTVVSSLVFCSVDDPAAGMAEIRRVLRPGGALRMMEHVRAHGRFWGWLQDVGQPGWTWLTGGCRPNRDTERLVREAGFDVEPTSKRGRGVFIRFEARVSRGPTAALLLLALTLAPTLASGAPPPAGSRAGSTQPAPLPDAVAADLPPPGAELVAMADGTSPPPEVTEGLMERPNGFDAWLDLPHAFLERRIFGVVNGFDRFFADERDLGCARSTSFIRARGEVRMLEDGTLEPGVSLRADLSLPYIQKRLRRLRIVLEDAGRGTVDSGPRAISSDAGGGRADALLRLTLFDTLRSAFDLGGGVLVDWPPGVVGRVRFRHNRELGNVALARIAATGYWNSFDGFGSKGTVALERALVDRLLLRWTSGTLISQVSSGFETASELALLARVGRYTAFTLLGSGAAVAKPELVLQTWRVAARARTSLFRSWIYGEVEPEVRWPLDALGGRRPVPSIVFRLEIQFEESRKKAPVAAGGACGLASSEKRPKGGA